MNRRVIAFGCEGATLFATLDLPEGAPASAGVVMVGGGNEIRAGAWAGHALLGQAVAAAGFAALRFDRRGVGDSGGDNCGFRSAGPDIAAAIAGLRREGVERIAGYGNCEGASALMLGGGFGLAALVLANPWTFEAEDEAAMPVQALRAYYRRRLANTVAVRRLITGKVSIAGLAAGIGRMLRPPPPPTSLAEEMAAGLARFSGPAAILIAGRDRTADAFLGHWDKGDVRLRHCPGASHSFVEAEARLWLAEQVIDMLNRL